MTLQERFFSKVEMDPNGGCWLWSGCQGQRGYGAFTMFGRTRGPEEKAHRVSWLLHKGEVPASGRKLAKEYGVSTSVISSIKKGQRWSHVQ